MDNATEASAHASLTTPELTTLLAWNVSQTFLYSKTRLYHATTIKKIVLLHVHVCKVKVKIRY